MDNKELLSMSDGLLIQLLQKNARYKVSDLAAALAESKDSIVERLNRLEKEKIICGYHTIVNWDKTNTELVTAMIEIMVMIVLHHTFISTKKLKQCIYYLVIMILCAL